MKINELGTILTAIASVHGEPPEKVEIDLISYKNDGAITIETSTQELNILSTIAISEKNKEA